MATDVDSIIEKLKSLKQPNPAGSTLDFPLYGTGGIEYNIQLIANKIQSEVGRTSMDSDKVIEICNAIVRVYKDQISTGADPALSSAKLAKAVEGSWKYVEIPSGYGSFEQMENEILGYMSVETGFDVSDLKKRLRLTLGNSGPTSPYIDTAGTAASVVRATSWKNYICYGLFLLYVGDICFNDPTRIEQIYNDLGVVIQKHNKIYAGLINDIVFAETGNTKSVASATTTIPVVPPTPTPPTSVVQPIPASLLTPIPTSTTPVTKPRGKFNKGDRVRTIKPIAITDSGIILPVGITGILDDYNEPDPFSGDRGADRTTFDKDPKFTQETTYIANLCNDGGFEVIGPNEPRVPIPDDLMYIWEAGGTSKEWDAWEKDYFKGTGSPEGVLDSMMPPVTTAAPVSTITPTPPPTAPIGTITPPVTVISDEISLAELAKVIYDHYMKAATSIQAINEYYTNFCNLFMIPKSSIVVGQGEITYQEPGLNQVLIRLGLYLQNAGVDPVLDIFEDTTKQKFTITDTKITFVSDRVVISLIEYICAIEYLGLRKYKDIPMNYHPYIVDLVSKHLKESIKQHAQGDIAKEIAKSKPIYKDIRKQYLADVLENLCKPKMRTIFPANSPQSIIDIFTIIPPISEQKPDPNDPTKTITVEGALNKLYRMTKDYFNKVSIDMKEPELSDKVVMTNNAVTISSSVIGAQPTDKGLIELVEEFVATKIKDVYEFPNIDAVRLRLILRNCLPLVSNATGKDGKIIASSDDEYTKYTFFISILYYLCQNDRSKTEFLDNLGVPAMEYNIYEYPIIDPKVNPYRDELASEIQMVTQQKVGDIAAAADFSLSPEEEDKKKKAEEEAKRERLAKEAKEKLEKEERKKKIDIITSPNQTYVLTDKTTAVIVKEELSVLPPAGETVLQVGGENSSEYSVRVKRQKKEIGVKLTTREDVRAMDALKNELKDIYDLMKEVFYFRDENILKVLMTTWLIQDGAVILWGIPGTGKTTLIEASTLLMCNDVDYTKSKYQSDVLDIFLKSIYGTFGVAVYNPSKLPFDVFYTAEIEIEKYLKNPISQDERKDMKPTGYETYNIDARPRNIVKSKVKHHNEFNRSSSIVQDALLRMMQEHEVEYRGKVFRSPPSVHFFDGNKYIMSKNKQYPDQALLDRIDASITVPNITPTERITMMAKKYGVNALNYGVKDLVVHAINNGDVKPINQLELDALWNITKNLNMSMRTVETIATALSLFSQGYREYKGGRINYEKGVSSVESDKISMFLGTTTIPRTKKLDMGDITFATGSEWKIFEMPKGDTEIMGVSPDDKPSAYALIDDIKQQIGHRTYDSFCRFFQAWKFLECCIEGRAVPAVIEITKKDIEVILKYVICHRLTWNPDTRISDNFLNYETVIDKQIVPLGVSPFFDKWQKFISIGFYYLNDKTITDLKDAMEKYDKTVMEVVFNDNSDNYKTALIKRNDYYYLRESFMTNMKLEISKRT